jgi:CRISPR-associated exonuclease Cas4
MCLEEMLACDMIATAYLYYGEIRRREPVALTDALRGTVRSMFTEMHRYTTRGYTPRVKPTKSCKACSMNAVCLPKLPGTEHGVGDYIAKRIASDAAEEDVG